MVGDDAQGFGSDEVEDRDGVVCGGEDGGAGGEREDLLDRGGVLEREDGAGGDARVPYPHRGVVAARHQHVAARAQAAGHEGAAAHIVLVADKLTRRRGARQVPETHRLVVASAHEHGHVGGRPLCDPDGLLVDVPSLEDLGAAAAGDVKDLHLAAVLAGDEDARVAADLAAAGDAVEAADGLERVALADGVDVDAGAGGDGEKIIVTGGGSG